MKKADGRYLYNVCIIASQTSMGSCAAVSTVRLVVITKWVPCAPHGQHPVAAHPMSPRDFHTGPSWACRLGGEGRYHFAFWQLLLGTKVQNVKYKI